MLCGLPQCGGGETGSGKAAQVWAETLRQRVFPDLQVGLLHGRMKGQEKRGSHGGVCPGKDADPGGNHRH